MSVTLHNLTASPKKSRKRIGRGGKRGTYSGRGMKGQRARSGGKSGLKRLGMKPLMTQTHKLRGFKSLNTKPAAVNLSTLNQHFDDGSVVTPKALLHKGLIKTTRYGVKILGRGELTKKITIEDCALSKGAAEKIK